MAMLPISGVVSGIAVSGVYSGVGGLFVGSPLKPAPQAGRAGKRPKAESA